MSRFDCVVTGAGGRDLRVVLTLFREHLEAPRRVDHRGVRHAFEQRSGPDLLELVSERLRA
jgi:hypothetical protein